MTIFFAVATTSAPQAPPLPPIPFAPVTCEGRNIPNLQVEGLPEIFLPVFDPVLTFATDVISDAEVAVPYEKSCAYVFYVKKQDPPKTTHRVINSLKQHTICRSQSIE